METSTMYTPFKINRLTLKNRIVKSAMFEFAADTGRITDKIGVIYEEAAKGGAGLIITGMQAVSSDGSLGPAMVQAGYEGYVQDLAQITQTVHRYGSKLIVQLQHTGSGLSCDGATEEELHTVAANFATAAKQCMAAGCDGVQVHAAHGFLINSFLSPKRNQRNDSYGGSIQGRARLLLEVCGTIRKAVGPGFAVGVKLPFSDLIPETSTPDEMLWVARELEKLGVDFIEVSSGLTGDGSAVSFSPCLGKGKPEGTFLEAAKLVADTVEIPVISVCGYRSPGFMERVLNGTKVAAISLGRPLVREPDLPNRWRYDSSPAKCISCNRCYGSAGGLRCMAAK